MRLICPKCQLRMKQKKTGVGAELMAEFGSYQLYAADLFECPGCGGQVVGYLPSQQPISQHHQGEEHKKWVEGYEKASNLFKYWETQKEKEKRVKAPRLEEPSDYEQLAHFIIHGKVKE